MKELEFLYEKIFFVLTVDVLIRVQHIDCVSVSYGVRYSLRTMQFFLFGFVAVIKV